MKVYETAKVIVDGKHIEDELRENDKPGHIGDFVLINVRSLHLAEGAQINAGAKIIGGGDFGMGLYSTLGYNTVVATGTDDTGAVFMNDYALDEDRIVTRGEVGIGGGAFIGPNCVLSVSARHPKLVIGELSVVRAGSYVNEDVGRSIIYGRWGSEKSVHIRRFRRDAIV